MDFQILVEGIDKHMAIHGFGNADLNDIRNFEKKNQIKLPNDYVDFLIKFNGGGVELINANSIHAGEHAEEINIDVLFGIKTSDSELSVEFWSSKYKAEMPHDAIIIGDSYQHGFIVILCSGKDSGIYYWDDTYHFPGSNDESNTYFLAKTFTEFIKDLL